MRVPGVNVVTRFVKKIPGYKGVVRTTARMAGPVARATGRVASRGVGAIRDGAVVVGKKSRNITRRIGNLFKRKSRTRTRTRAKSKSRSVKKSRAKSRASRSRNNRNRNVVLPNVKRNNALKPIVVPAPAPAPAPALAIKNTNSPLVGAVGNMAIAPRPY